MSSSTSRSTNSSGACQLIETLIAASSRGLREPLIIEVFRDPKRVRGSFTTRRVGGMSEKRIRSFLRRLEREGRLVNVGDGRWCTPAQFDAHYSSEKEAA